MGLHSTGAPTPSGNGLQTIILACLTAVLLVSPVMSFLADTAGGDHASELANGYGSAAGDGFGWSVTYIGDIDGDGHDDIAVGAPYDSDSFSNAGAVHIFYGPTPNINATLSDLSINGASADDYLGWSVASDDVNSDGEQDLIMGAPGADTVYVLWSTILASAGATINMASPPAGTKTLTGTAGSGFGKAVSGAGNFDGTAGAEVIVGAPNASSDEGKAYVYNGAGGMTNTPYLTMSMSGGINTSLGFAVTGAGDFDDTGSDEIAVGAPGNASLGGPNSGVVYVVPSQTSGSIDMLTDTNVLRIEDQLSGTGLGSALANVGDMTGEGWPDLAIGAPNGTGQVFVIPGTSNLGRRITTLGMPTLTGGNVQHFGHSVASGGDINFDGHKDIIVGAPWHGGTNNSRGTVFVFFGDSGWSGSTSLVHTQADMIMIGPSLRTQHGKSVAGDGDYDNDGKKDILVGAPFTPKTAGQGFREGSTHVYRHNVVPVLSATGKNLVTPISGTFNGASEFTYTIIYSDQEDDPPQWVKLELYSKADGSKVSAYPGNNQIPSLTKTGAGNDFTQGVEYQLTTQLPHGQYYFKFISRASQGNTSQVQYPLTGDLPLGPFVDSIAPRVSYINATSTGEDLDKDGEPDSEGPFGVNGTCQMTWLAPGDDKDQGNLGENGTYEIKYSEDEITLSNWNQTASVTELGVDIPVVGPANTQETLDISGLTPGHFYWFAMRTTDGHNNTSPISSGYSGDPSAQAFKIVKDTTPPLDLGVWGVDLYDTPADHGGNLTVTWRRGLSADYADVTYYNIYLDTVPITNDLLNVIKPVIKHHPHTSGTMAYVDRLNGQPLQDGTDYYVAVTPLDEWKNQAKVITEINVDGPAQPMDNFDDPPAVLTGIQAYDTPDDYGRTITVEWDACDEPDFRFYKLYVSTQPVRDLGDPILEKFLPEDEEYEVKKYQGDSLKDGNRYYFVVTAVDWNEKENPEIVKGSNYAGPVQPRNNTDDEAPLAIEGVKAFDKPNDAGGNLTLQWNATEARDFSHYNIYMDDAPITDLFTVEPAFQYPTKGTTPVEMVVKTFDGARLIDGHGYYFTVTAVDYNGDEGNEDTTITEGNTFGPAESVDNTDLDAPVKLEGVTINSYGKTWVEMKWNPLSSLTLPDFNQYIIIYARERPVVPDSDTAWDMGNDINLSYIDSSTSKVYGLLKGREYHFRMVVMDDNFNVNYSAASRDIFVTLLGGNQAPELYEGSIDPATGDTDTKFTFRIKWKDPDEDNYEEKGYLKVIVDNVTLQAKFIMEEGDPLRGATYKLEYTRPFTPGTHRFYFEANDRPDTLNPVRFPAGNESLTFFVEGDENDGEIIDNGEKDDPIQMAIMILIMLIVFGGVGGGMYMADKRRQERERKKRREEEKKRKAYADHVKQVGEWRCACGKTKSPMDEEAICVECGDVHELLEMDQDLLAVTKQAGVGTAGATVDAVPEDMLANAAMATPHGAGGGAPPMGAPTPPLPAAPGTPALPPAPAGAAPAAPAVAAPAAPAGAAPAMQPPGPPAQ